MKNKNFIFAVLFTISFVFGLVFAFGMSFSDKTAVEAVEKGSAENVKLDEVFENIYNSYWAFYRW